MAVRLLSGAAAPFVEMSPLLLLSLLSSLSPLLPLSPPMISTQYTDAESEGHLESSVADKTTLIHLAHFTIQLVAVLTLIAAGPIIFLYLTVSTDDPIAHTYMAR